MATSGAYSLLNLDANASFGLHPRVEAGLREELGAHLNPSSIHRGGQATRVLIEEARSRIGSYLGLSRKDRVIFTSGATESNNTAIEIPFSGTSVAGGTGNDLVLSSIEHPSVLECARRLGRRGYRVGFLTPSKNAAIDLDVLKAAISPSTRLFSWMHANNETGHCYDVGAFAAVARKANPEILVHSDAVQSLGKITLRFDELNVDMLSISAHKIGGLPGIGALVVSARVPAVPLLTGGPQEARWRAGTENVLGIISFGLAVEVLQNEFSERRRAMRQHCEIFSKIVLSALPNTKLNSLQSALPNTLSLTLDSLQADDLVVALDVEGILISSGAACASGKPEASHVLLALGLTPSEAKSTVRVSFTGLDSDGAVENAAKAFVSCVRRMRKEAA